MRLCKLFLLGVTTEVTFADDDGKWSKEDFQKNLADKVDKMPDNIEKIEHEKHPEEQRIELLKREYLGPSRLMHQRSVKLNLQSYSPEKRFFRISCLVHFLNYHMKIRPYRIFRVSGCR